MTKVDYKSQEYRDWHNAYLREKRKKKEWVEADKERRYGWWKKRYHSDPEFRQREIRKTCLYQKTSHNRRLAIYKTTAKKKGVEFGLDREEALNLFAQACVYCGAHNDVGNGIDRVDNSQGYLPTNCVSCCKTCNYMKHALSKGDFLAHIGSIHLKNGATTADVSQPGGPRKSCRSKVGAARRDARHRGLEFSISQEEAEGFVTKSCSYCAVLPQLFHGIDRLDNTKAYVTGNCVPCCRVCNMMKKNLTKAQFLEHVARIYEFQHKTA